MLQLTPTPAQIDLYAKYGSSGVAPIYGAGCLHKPRLMLVFMNPTGRNVSSIPTWPGLRAPWLGIKKTWVMLATLGLIDAKAIDPIRYIKPAAWTPEQAHALYAHVAAEGLYITNLAACTQPDARHLPDRVFKDYLPTFMAEVQAVQPQHIVTFGNQVSSVVLQRLISVSQYQGYQYEELCLHGQAYRVYPTWYPVGQGQRNITKAIARLQAIINNA